VGIYPPLVSVRRNKECASEGEIWGRERPKMPLGPRPLPTEKEKKAREVKAQTGKHMRVEVREQMTNYQQIQKCGLL